MEQDVTGKKQQIEARCQGPRGSSGDQRTMRKNIHTVILADTRGEGLQKVFDDRKQKDIYVLAEEEYGMEDIVLSKLQDLRILQPTLIIITNGISDLTVKESNTQARKLKYKTREDAVRNSVAKAKRAQDIISRELPKTKVVFGTITGCDLAVCGTQHSANDQQILNKTVIELNKKLTDLNLTNGMPTALTSIPVHVHSSSNMYNEYSHLSDGYRLSNHAKSVWVKELRTCIRIVNLKLAKKKYKVLMVTDSRSADVEKYVQDWENIVLDVVNEPNGGMKAGAELLVTLKKDESADAIFVLNGIRDVLDKNEDSQTYSFKWPSAKEAVHSYMEQAQEAYKLLRQHFPRSTKIAFITLTGADLTDCHNPKRKGMKQPAYRKYNATKIQDPSQEALNAAVDDINREIHLFNKAHDIPSMKLSTVVHKCIKNTWHSHFYTLLEDGYHLKATTKILWANELKKSIEKVQDVSSKRDK